MASHNSMLLADNEQTFVKLLIGWSLTDRWTLTIAQVITPF